MRLGPLRSLPAKRDFEAVFKTGVSAASKYTVIYARPNELFVSRVGLSVSRKVGNAVTRNRLKRLLREAMRKRFDGLALHYDFVIIARKASAKAELGDFTRDIERFLSRLIHEKDSDIALTSL